MMRLTPLRRRALWLFAEHIMAICTVGALVLLILKFRYQGYLSAPFVFDSQDTFMDWFNTSLYAHNIGAYDIWRTVYAPLSFVFLRLTGDPSCYQSSPFDARECDVRSLFTIGATFVLCGVVAGIAIIRKHRILGWPRAISFAISMPMLFALERGNVIMVAFIPFALLFGEVVQSKWSRATCMALIINFKFYLAFPLVAYFVRREWRLLEIGAFATLMCYLLTLAFMGDGTPMQISRNLDAWFSAVESNVWDQLYYSTSYSPIMAFDRFQYPVRDFIDQRRFDYVVMAVPILINASRLLAVGTIGLSWFFPDAIPRYRIALLALLQSFVSQSPGGYGEIFITFLVFLEKPSSAYVALAILAAYLLSLPGDITIDNFAMFERKSWLSGRVVDAYFGLSVGAFARPGLLVAILWLLAIDSLRAFAAELKSRAPLTFGMQRHHKLVFTQ